MILATWLVICCVKTVDLAHWLLSMSTSLPTLATRAASSVGPELLWQVPIAGRGTPAVYGASVYFLSRHHELIAVDARTGHLRWRRAMSTSPGTTAGSSVRATASVVIAGDDDVLAFGHDGAFAWRFGPGAGDGAGLYLGDVSGPVALAGSRSGHLYAIDVATGRQRWAARIAQDGVTTVFPPLVSGGLVMAGYTSFGAPSAGGVVACDLSTGRERWRRVLPSPAGGAGGSGFSGGLLEAGHLVLVVNRDGVIHALDRASGEGRSSFPAVAAAMAGAEARPDFRALGRRGRTIFAGSLSGTVVAYDRETGRELWRRTPIEASVGFGVATDEQAVYVPYLNGQLVALDARTGAERWRTSQASAELSWMPLPAGGRLFAIGSAAGLLAFRP